MHKKSKEPPKKKDQELLIISPKFYCLLWRNNQRISWQFAGNIINNA